MAGSGGTARAVLAAALVTGCQTRQSALHPAGPHAEAVNLLGWVMTAGGALIFALVMALLAFAVLGPARGRALIASGSFIPVMGIAFPVVVLTALLVTGLALSDKLRNPGEPRLRVEVVGEQWWWRIHYLDGSGAVRLATANEIHIPVDVPVEFVLKATDVIHSFWVPSLAGKLDMIPGRANRYTFSAQRPGAYRGQCAEFCGAQHALMAFTVVALEKPAFDAWFAKQSADALDPPSGGEAYRGATLFNTSGCGACHEVRGTPANGRIGPDLTHVGSRLTIAAGTLPNNPGTLAAWTASAQHIKPGNRMPSFSSLSGPELRAVAAYLGSLR